MAPDVHLQYGIALIQRDLASGSTREDRPNVEVSHGLAAAPCEVFASNHQSLPLSYEPDALIPRPPWSVPTKETLDTLRGKDEPIPRATVAIFTLPETLWTAFDPAGQEAERIHDWSGVNAFVSSVPAVDVALQHAMNYASDPEAKIWQVGIRVNPPGLPSVTVDRASDRLVGLHFDNWFDAPILRRHESPNRIAFNLGLETRFLTYVNLPLARVWEIAYGSEPDSQSKVTADLLSRFAEQARNYPVTRVRIGPGQGYIAPTDNILHDGSTEGSTRWDIYFTVVSRFQVHEVWHSQA